jgi:lysyl-tRNA synthetase, class II
MSALDDIMQERIAKKEKLIAENINPYPELMDKINDLDDLINNFNEGNKVKVAGRVMSVRAHGALVFFHIKNDNSKVQVLLKKDKLNDQFDLFKETIDIGDFIYIQGDCFLTKTNEKTIEADEWKIISKSIRPIPSEFYGLEDVEEKYRKRYLDILINSETKRVFDLRWKIIYQIREFLNMEKFIEVETPVLQAIYGGTLAKPFTTHLNDLDMDVYLRIAPEMFLKRVLVSGYSKIFEIAKCFRNESIDREHNPEFTLLELYQAFANKEDLMNLMENLFKALVEKNNLQKYINISVPFERLSIINFVKEKSGLDYFKNTLDDFADYLKSNKIEVEKGMSKAKMFDAIFKKFRSEIKGPLFIIDHPIDLSPLAKARDDDERIASRFQLLVGGLELCNGWSELNDPSEQAKRFKEQEENKKAGDKEAHPYDKDFIEALEYGMPMAAGIGIGIDRLITVLAEAQTLRDTIIFPFMKNIN